MKHFFLLVLLLVSFQGVVNGFDFSGMTRGSRAMFYNVGIIEVIDARKRLGLHIPSEKDTFNTCYFNMPKRHEVIRIAARSTPTAPGEQVVECVATVKRDDVNIMVMLGKVYFQSMPPV
ncbi:unnamed protein product [Caenorhabditis nigoni]